MGIFMGVSCCTSSRNIAPAAKKLDHFDREEIRKTAFAAVTRSIDPHCIHSERLPLKPHLLTANSLRGISSVSISPNLEQWLAIEQGKVRTWEIRG